MSKLVNGVMVGLVVFVIVVSGFWFLFEMGSPTDLVVEGVFASWRPAGADRTAIDVDVEVRNAHQFAVRVEEARFEFWHQGGRLAEGTMVSGFLIPGRQVGTVPLHADFPNSFAVDWWFDHTLHGERSSFEIRGNVSIQLGGTRTDLSFVRDFDAQSSMEPGLEEAAANCGNVEIPVCIAQTQADFTGAQPPGVLDLRQSFRNENSTPARIENLSVALQLARITVAEERVSGFDLGPHEEREIRIPLSVLASAMPGWWAEHVRACESSAVVIALRFDHIETENALGTTDGPTKVTAVTQVSWSFSSSTMRTGILCAP